MFKFIHARGEPQYAAEAESWVRSILLDDGWDNIIDCWDGDNFYECNLWLAEVDDDPHLECALYSAKDSIENKVLFWARVEKREG